MRERMPMGHAPLLLWRKKTARDTSGVEIKPVTKIFRLPLAEYGEKVGVAAQWPTPDATLPQAPTHSQKISD